MAGKHLTDEERHALLEQLSRIPVDADADDDVIRTFLPTPIYERALDQRVLVIRGERGAGKTALFKLIHAASTKGIPLRELIEGAPQGVRIEGFAETGTIHPPVDVIEKYAWTAAPEALRAFWLGHLAARLHAELRPEADLPPAFGAVYANHVTDLGRWVPAAQACLPELYAWLDKLESGGKTTCFVIYDHLDRIAPNQSDVRRKLAIALLGLWLSLSQRYDHLRGKILLREDLFQAALTSFADASKLEARSVRLEWNAGKLYALLVRRIATFDRLEGWLTDIAGVELSKRKHLGLVPKPEFDETDQSRFATQLVGQYMGAGPTKGLSYKWLISHLQDANLRVTPRSLLELIRGAAETALDHGPKASFRRLLDPTEIQSSLEKASKRRVNELEEDYPVVGSLESLRGQMLFLSKREVLNALRGYGKNMENRREPNDMYEELLQIGVLSDRGSDRIDVPDIIRYKFGIKRKGGVRRVG